MKKILTSWIFVFFIFAPIFVFGMQDEIIPAFLAEYIDGKPTGNLMQFQLHIMESNNGNRWVLSQIDITPDDYDKTMYFQAYEKKSDERTDLPWIQNLTWEQGKKVSFIFLPDGNDKVQFTAKKVPGTKYGWNVKCIGEIKGAVTKSEVKSWEWKATKTIELKYKKVKFVDLYNQ